MKTSAEKILVDPRLLIWPVIAMIPTNSLARFSSRATLAFSVSTNDFMIGIGCFRGSNNRRLTEVGNVSQSKVG